MTLYFDMNYPKNLAKALELLHELDRTKKFTISRTPNISNIDKENSVIFLTDNKKKGIDIVVDKHFEDGYKVFAFKLHSAEGINFFKMTLMTLKLWPKILKTINKERDPFVYTFSYVSRRISRVR